MKKLYFLLLLLPVMSFSQVINFPDPNFKSLLIASGTDYNSDGEIDQQEAAMKFDMVVTGDITSLEGLNFFINLDYLQIIGTDIEELDLNGVSNLTQLMVESTSISALDLTAVPNLVLLEIPGNNITSLDLSPCPLLTVLNAYDNPLSTLNLQSNQLLTNVTIELTDITTLDISGHESIIELGTDSLVNLNASGCSSLQTLYAGGVQNLNLSGCTSLATILIGGDIHSIDLTGCSAITSLHVESSHLTTIDISDCSSLQSFMYNDFGNVLETAFLKNNSSETSIYFNFGTSLVYVCADEDEIAGLQQMLQNDSSSNPNTLITSQCTDKNLVTGTATLDVDGDGCSDVDIPMNQLKIQLSDNEVTRTAFTNGSGLYSLYTTAGTYNVEPVLANPSLFTVQNTSVTFNEDLGGLETVNFCLTPLMENPDLTISIIPLGVAMPGFDTTYQLVLRNTGNQIATGSLLFSYEDSILDYVSASPQGQLAAGSISWDVEEMLPFETRTINITLNLNAPTETPAVNINDLVNLTAEVTIAVDVYPADNIFELQQTVVGSYDPNDKVCLQGSVQSPTRIGDYLHYIINFENTGTAAAQFVRITDEINVTEYDLESFELVATSHNASTRLEGNVAEFMFEGINLGPDQHGFASFRIKTNSELVEGDTVSNQANIYFDYNFPIETNVASTTFTQLGVSENISGAFRSFPNPVRDILTITAAFDIINVALYDVQGRELYNNSGGDQTIYINMSDQASGVYLAKVTTLDGVQSQKIIKQ
jgi:hypothetical protein